MLLYFSGSHATGKSTIIEHLCKKYLSNVTPLDLDRYHTYSPNQLLNEKQRYHQQVRHAKQCKSSTHFYITDRGPWDHLVYSIALEKAGVFDKDQLEIIRLDNQHGSDVFFNNNTHVVFLDYSVEKVIENIKKRNREPEIKSIFNNRDFIECLIQSFRDFYAQVGYLTPLITIKEQPSLIEVLSKVLLRLWEKQWIHVHNLTEEGRKFVFSNLEEESTLSKYLR